MDPNDVNSNTAAASGAEIADVKVADTSVAPAADAPAQAPSEPSKGSDREELLKVVQDAIKPKDEGDTPAKGADTPSDPKATGEPAPANSEAKPNQSNQTDDQLPELTEAEIKGYDRRSQKRIRQLVAKGKELEAKLAQYEPVASFGSEVQSFMETNKLSKDDTNMLLGIGAALRKGDFETFLKGVMPYVQVAQEALGHTLPQDIQQKVNDGLIDVDAAREMARLRTSQHLTQERLREVETERAQATVQQLVSSIHSAVTEWEGTVRQRDPDYAAKQGAILRFSQALVTERGAPRTAAEAVKLAQDAYDEVNRVYGQFKPAVQPTRPSPSASSQTATSASPEPRSLMEAALRGLRAASG